MRAVSQACTVTGPVSRSLLPSSLSGPVALTVALTVFLSVPTYLLLAVLSVSVSGSVMHSSCLLNEPAPVSVQAASAALVCFVPGSSF